MIRVNLPEWLTEAQIEDLENIADRLIGQGEEAGASENAINKAIRDAQLSYINRNKPTR